jgi:hypothetical protein
MYISAGSSSRYSSRAGSLGALRDDIGETLEAEQRACVVGEFVLGDGEGGVSGGADAEGHGLRDVGPFEQDVQPVAPEPVVDRSEQLPAVRAALHGQDQHVGRDAGPLREPGEVGGGGVRDLAGELVGDVDRVLAEAVG